MMQGRHPEEPPPSGQLEKKHLEDYGNHLDKINKPDNRYKQLKLHHIGGRRHKAPQRQGTGIPHENAGRIHIKQQKSQQRPRNSAGDRLSLIHI